MHKTNFIIITFSTFTIKFHTMLRRRFPYINMQNFLLFRSLSSGNYTLQNNVTLEQYDVYCHMDEITGCGKGGWTLVMKVNGKMVNHALQNA